MKKFNIYLIVLAAVSFLFFSCVAKEGKVSTNIAISNYIPYTENSKVVRLSEESTLKLENNLPKIDGATALYPLYAAFVQAVYPEGDYTPFSAVLGDYDDAVVQVNGTSSAYYSLINGWADIIFCAGPSDEQIEMARENGVELIMTPIGKEAFVFFVHKNNPVSNLTTENIINIYSGAITNWSEIGGRDDTIRAYQRNKNSGSQTMLESIMGDTKIKNPIEEDVIGLMLETITRTADYKNYKSALGYSFLFFTTQMVQNNSIKLLAINNIQPSIEAIQNNTYPYIDNFYAITINRENANANLFIEWILSEQGQYLVEKTGFVPIGITR